MEKELKQMELNEEVLDAVNGGMARYDTGRPELEKGNPNDFNNNSGEPTGTNIGLDSMALNMD